jgi:phosphoribosylformylglycinamidine synthase
MKVGIVVFPGSNCDRDTEHAFEKVLGVGVERLWHKDSDLKGVDAIVLPGGFSFGDYLRTGAVARFSPIMESVADFAARGGRVLGICNGFQILLEAGLLPGAMLPNRSLRFICRDVTVRVEQTGAPVVSKLQQGQLLRIPVAHYEGNWFCDDETLARVEAEGLPVLRYCDAAGVVSDETNLNGSRNNIAGLRNAAGNVVGMMPHPERCSEPALGGIDGRALLEGLLS